MNLLLLVEKWWKKWKTKRGRSVSLRGWLASLMLSVASRIQGLSFVFLSSFSTDHQKIKDIDFEFQNITMTCKPFIESKDGGGRSIIFMIGTATPGFSAARELPSNCAPTYSSDYPPMLFRQQCTMPTVPFEYIVFRRHQASSSLHFWRSIWAAAASLACIIFIGRNP